MYVVFYLVLFRYAVYKESCVFIFTRKKAITHDFFTQKYLVHPHSKNMYHLPFMEKTKKSATPLFSILTFQPLVAG